MKKSNKRAAAGHERLDECLGPSRTPEILGKCRESRASPSGSIPAAAAAFAGAHCLSDRYEPKQHVGAGDSEPSKGFQTAAADWKMRWSFERHELRPPSCIVGGTRRIADGAKPALLG